MIGKYIFTISIFFISLLINSCDNSTETENSDYNLYGKVVDSNGNAIEGAGIHYDFEFVSSSAKKAVNPYPSTNIDFQVPSKTKVKLDILRWHTRELLAVLIDDTLNAGNYSVKSTTSKMTNGFYIYQLTIDDIVEENVFLNEIFNVDELMDSDPLSVTNSEGEFTLPHKLFGFDVDVTRTSIEGDIIAMERISNTIDIIVVAPNRSLSYHEITIDSRKDINRTFVVK